jgi:predicted O-linked N-acetylglucosamine transferase (SPINDLY family)
MQLKAAVAAAAANGWRAVDALFEKNLAGIKKEDHGAFTDAFWFESLQLARANPPDGSVWRIAIRWHGARNLSTFGHDVSPVEQDQIFRFMAELRQEFVRTLLQGIRALPELPEAPARAAILMWRDLFLSSHSILNQNEAGDGLKPNIVKEAGHSVQPKNVCQFLLIECLQNPFAAERSAVDVEALLAAKIPVYLKVILAMWLVNIPRYNATPSHRQKILHYMPTIFRVSRTLPAWMDPFFHLLTEWFMVCLFRLAYIHEDNSRLSRLFGDYIVLQINRLLPQACQMAAQEKGCWKPPAKIKLGYFSSKFVANAVTFYMANRILRHDRNLFEIHIFSLGNRQDDMTAILAKNCDRFVSLENPLDYAHNAEIIRDSKLDILLYADIGMEIYSYLMAGLRLAPVQAALLGHASPTGLPTVDYFFSSEAEPADAEKSYREKLICLPGPGADQLYPPGLQGEGRKALTRSQLGIPDDAFVFVSCANGMKHIPERDILWTEILRRIPRAWILLKPFSPGDTDRRLAERIKRAGEQAGAAERIRCIEGVDSHLEVFSILGLADIQLDTFPFNGWTTTVEAICMGLPMVSQEGVAYRSRLGSSFLRAMGIHEGIAADEDEYVQWAERFANDPALCRWVRNRIKATRKSLLFENHTVQIAYEKALIEMSRESGGVK